MKYLTRREKKKDALDYSISKQSLIFKKQKQKITGMDLPTQRKRVLKGQCAPKKIIFKTEFKIGGSGRVGSWHNFRCFLKETIQYKNVNFDKPFVKL